MQSITIGEMPTEFLGNWYDTDNGSREWRFGITLVDLRTGNRFWTYEEIIDLGQGVYDVKIANGDDIRLYRFRNITASTMEYRNKNWDPVKWVTATR